MAIEDHMEFTNRLSIVLAVILASFAGCTQQPEAVFSLSETVKQLPQGHQDQIQAILTRHFGTPSNPRVLVPGEGDEDSGEGAAEDGESAFPVIDRFEPDALKLGAAVYNRRCALCHGVSGDGNGTAAQYLNPKPRDYRRGIYKFTSTPYGAKPRRQDLIRTIRRGAKGTSMPAFRWLPDDELQAVVDYVILLSYRGELEGSLAYEAEDYEEDEELDPELIPDLLSVIDSRWTQAAGQIVLPVTTPIPMTDESVQLGQQAFLSKGCSKCHGADGRGHTQDNVGQDSWGNTVKAADLTSGMLHGGRRSIDVYRRIYSGINGTPMPSFATQFAQDPETIWHLAHFVLAVAEGREIEASSVASTESSEAPSPDES